MADQRDGSVVIDTEIDTKGLTNAIDQMNKVMDGFVKKVTGGFGNIDKDIDTTARKASKLKIEPTTEGINEAVRQLDNLNAQIEVQETQLGSYQREYERLSERFGSTSDQALAMQKRILTAEAAIAKMTKSSEQLAEDIGDAEQAMKDGYKSSDQFNKKLEESEKSAKKAGDGMSSFSHAVSHFIIDMVEKAISSLVSLIDKTEKFRSSMSILDQNTRDSGVSLEVVDDAMRRLNAVTGDTDDSMKAVSNLLAAGFKENNLLDAVDTLAGAVLKFPGTGNIDHLASSLQETLATKEATGQLADVLGRVGINVDDFNKRIAKMSTTQAANYTISQLQRKGLEDITKDWREHNKEAIAAANASFELQKAQSRMAAVMEPIRTKILTSLTNLLVEHQDTIEKIIGVVGNAIDTVIRAADELMSVPAAIWPISAAIGAVVGMIIPLGTQTNTATKAVKGISNPLSIASSGAATAGAKFALLALEITAVATAIALVIEAIADLVYAFKGIPKSGNLASNLTGGLSPRGYALGTVSARRGLALVGERGPELVDFRGGERVFNATQTSAMQTLAPSGGSRTYQDNRQYIFKVDDIATYVAIENRLKGERQSRRMGYVGAY